MPRDETTMSCDNAEVIGDPEMLARLRAWAEPMCGGHIPDDGPGNIRQLQEIIESAAAGAGVIPQYRKPNA